jgi:hypothetical protein
MTKEMHYGKPATRFEYIQIPPDLLDIDTSQGFELLVEVRQSDRKKFWVECNRLRGRYSEFGWTEEMVQQKALENLRLGKNPGRDETSLGRLGQRKEKIRYTFRR